MRLKYAESPLINRIYENEKFIMNMCLKIFIFIKVAYVII